MEEQKLGIGDCPNCNNKPQANGKMAFLGIVFLLGGLICIFVTVSELQWSSIVTVVSGILLVMQGTVFIFDSRPKSKKKEE